MKSLSVLFFLLTLSISSAHAAKVKCGECTMVEHWLWSSTKFATAFCTLGSFDFKVTGAAPKALTWGEWAGDYDQQVAVEMNICNDIKSNIVSRRELQGTYCSKCFLDEYGSYQGKCYDFSKPVDDEKHIKGYNSESEKACNDMMKAMTIKD